MSEKEKKDDSRATAGEAGEAEDEKMEGLFVPFISGLYTSTMQQLGKLMNPLTGKVDRNLDAAHATIELVRMLKEKTKGNLTKKESGAISSALSNMQMNYVDELKREEEKDKKNSSKQS